MLTSGSVSTVTQRLWGGAMCRLFGLTAGAERVRATFWLLDAPDSLVAQSRRNVDGSGIGFFNPSGAAALDRQPEPGFVDGKFIKKRSRPSRRPSSRTCG